MPFKTKSSQKKGNKRVHQSSKNTVKIPARPAIVDLFSVEEQVKENSRPTMKQAEIPHYDKNTPYAKAGMVGFKTRAVKGVYAGISFDSKIEVILYIYFHDVLGLPFTRNTETALIYRDLNGVERKFYPDFIKEGKLFEVKGVVSPRDRCKREQHPCDVEWWVMAEKKEEFARIKKEVYKHFPHWENYYR